MDEKMDEENRIEPIGECGCRLERTDTGLRMVDCPLHAAAPEMRTLLGCLVCRLSGLDDSHKSQQLLDVEYEAIALLAQIEPAVKAAEGGE